MRPIQKVGLTVLIVFAFLLVSWGTLFASVYASGGVITVSVDPGPEGGRFYLAVPVALLDAAAVAGSELIEPEEMRLEAHLGDWQPLVVAILEGLDDIPDATLVEVDDGADHVRIVKRGGRLRVEVEDSEVSVRVAVPIRALARTVDRLVV